MKDSTDQYHWDFDRLLQRAQLVLESWKGAANIDQERLDMAEREFNEAFKILLMCIEGA